MPQKRRSQSWTELKQTGNECFRAGQYGEAVNLYSQSIQLLVKSGQKNKEDLGILYSNRAASYLKDGNCNECIKDCTSSLELVPFGFKALLRRASAYEALERYRQAYVDYKTVLQIDWNIPAAHDGVNRMTKALTDIDGPSWREKLPPIPTVPMSVKESLAQAASSSPRAQQNRGIDDKKKAPGAEAAKKAKALKEEGNAFVKKGEHKKALEKYTQSLAQDPTEVTTYTNRALCYLSLKIYKEAISDCSEALRLDSANIKAFYRRAQANKELKNKKSAVEDLNSVLKIEPNNTAAQKLLQEVQKMK
ncbi:mitochondrial import receptor subunit TOM34 [Puntigrus tetrazona]|uniref:mitochondrial import receptor subunit TOM34 n=1 Tax=Puntigrus tetrazona TaxID=1606681 RepID=UPI001C8AFD94|nr:mitochondrial import receptor subunit TOM34 [Puntigrus tetrazona]XP_043098800.1 mitochondrial import receptor subunit TOM34 [Puntigrus tetrazona]